MARPLKILARCVVGPLLPYNALISFTSQFGPQSFMILIMPTPQHTRWCFTINNPTPEDAQRVSTLGEGDLTRYLVVGRERGERGTDHLQGFVVFVRPASRTRVSGILRRAHLEPARGTSQQASEYCKKDGDYDEFGTCPGRRGAGNSLDPFFEWGDEFIRDNNRAPTDREIANSAHRNVLLRYRHAPAVLALRAPPPVLQQGESRAWQQDLAAELLQDADDRSVIFYVDEDGGTGKTWFQHWFVTQHSDVTQLMTIGKRDDLAYMIDVTKSVFLMNVPRGGMQYLSYKILEMIKDRVIFSPKYQAQMKILTKTPWVVVFCNEAPDQSKMSVDRFDIRTEFND